MKISESNNYLITTYQNISEKNINEDIEIEIYNHQRMKLDMNGRDVRYFLDPKKDITLIELIKTDIIFNAINFLNFDLNYEKSYEIYSKTLFCPIFKKDSIKYEFGQLMYFDYFEFHHNIWIKEDISGLPVLILIGKGDNRKINVVGIHKNFSEPFQFNLGTFIHVIFLEEREEKEEENEKNKNKYKVNFITTNQLFKFSIFCEKTEEKLYLKNPKLKDKKLYFLANGNTVNTSGTLEQNKIDNETTILINEMEN